MTNYKFNIDKPEPKEEQIKKHKDFKKVMYNYQKATKPLYMAPLYKNPFVFIFLVVVVILAYLISEYADTEQKIPAPKQDSVQNK